MAKSKGGGEEGKSDDLEIISIGAIYSGPWDKKYWSSSRGKDRYPYPVGYKAVRAHNGNTYKMKIQEGPKGPLFLITYSGKSCSGQTPDIAWEKFQKMGFSHLKIWHRKRFSCKIDGVEFFGFKNPLVQRLLRELVANINGTAENSSLASSSRDGVSKTCVSVGESYSVTCKYPNLLPFFDRPVARKKRSRRTEIVCQKSADSDCPKKPRIRDLLSGGEVLNSAPGNGRNHEPSRSLEGKKDPCVFPRIRPHELHLKTVVTEEIQCLSSENPLQMKSTDLFVSPQEPVVPTQEADQLPGPESCKPKPVSNFSEELGRLQDVEDKVANSVMATKDRTDDVPVLTDSQDTTGSNLFAPDTLDFLQDNTTSSALNIEDDTTRQLKEEFAADNMLFSGGLISEPQSKELAGSSLNVNSEKTDSDSDSAGQEIAKSMMTLLLPQAIPLLMMASNRKQKKNNTLGKPFSGANYAENNKSSHLADAAVSASSPTVKACNVEDENMHLIAPDSDLNIPDFTNTVSIIPDSFDGSHLDIHSSDHIMSSSEEAHPADFDQLPIIQEQFAIVNVRASLVSDVETSRSKDIYSYDDVRTILDENVREDYMKKPMSVLQCTSPTERLLSEGSQDLCAEVEGKFLPKEKHYKNEDLKDTLPSVEGTDSVVDAKPAQVGSDTQVKHKVYTRKRVSTHQQEKNRNPSSESDNRVRNVGDDSLTKVSPSMKTPVFLELQQVISTKRKTDKTDSLGDEINHEEQQSHSFNSMKMTEKRTNLSNNMASAVSQDSRSAHGLETACISTFSIPASKVENFQAHSEEELTIHERKAVTTELHYTATNRCEKSICNVKKLPAFSDFKLQKEVKINSELERTVELLGCYCHPMPVSSVLLKPIGDEIYICVSCGPTADRFSTLFVYKLAAKEPIKGCPSYIGHTPAILPFADDKSGRYVNAVGALERFGLQLTPDGRYLVLFDSIKTPYCREGMISCSCSTCKSACFEENTVRIVEVKLGHVSLVTKLKAVDDVQCLVVCDPCYLTAVGKSGRMIVWIMNSSWSGPVEEFTIPVNPCISSCIVELKKIPRCPHLVVGHSGAGEFTIWDISKRVLVSWFSSPSSSVYEFIPISVFPWHHIFSHSTMEDRLNRILAVTKLWFSNQIDNHALVPTDGKDTGLWLLVSTAADSDAQSNNVSTNYGENPVRCWRLALLVKNAVIFGCQLDPRAAVAGATSGHGIVGTHDGLVYMWDLSTGAKLGSLHRFKGRRVSCVSTDDSGSGNLCIASDDGQLLVYRHPKKFAANQLG